MEQQADAPNPDIWEVRSPWTTEWSPPQSWAKLNKKMLGKCLINCVSLESSLNVSGHSFINYKIWKIIPALYAHTVSVRWGSNKMYPHIPSLQPFLQRSQQEERKEAYCQLFSPLPPLSSRFWNKAAQWHSQAQTWLRLGEESQLRDLAWFLVLMSFSKIN